MKFIIKHRYWILFIIFIVIDVILAAFTWQEVRESIGWVKNIPQKTNFKLRHIIQYAPQSLILCFALEKSGISKLKISVYIVLTFLAVGGVTEVIQCFTPSRIPSFYDVLWNVFGGLFGLLIYLFLRKVGTWTKS